VSRPQVEVERYAAAQRVVDEVPERLLEPHAVALHGQVAPVLDRERAP
jgi:hypothetical protein